MKKVNLQNILDEVVSSLDKAEVRIGDDGKVHKMTPFDYSNYIIDNSKYKICQYAERIYIYFKGVYLSFSTKAKALDFVKKCIMKISDLKSVPLKKIENTFDELHTHYHELVSYEEEGLTFINLKSNVLALRSDGSTELLPHDEKYNFTYKLDFDFDENAISPVFDKFLQTSLGDEELSHILEEYFGYVLNRNSKSFEKALFLYGDGSNGKSTLLNILKALLGKENISHIELSDMSDMNKCAMMDGKLLNISSDASKKGLDTSSFKKIVSCEPIIGKFLYKNTYTIENIPKLMIALNKLPYHNGDNSFGFYRRILLIPFDKTIKEEDKDYDLESKVIENELPAILNRAILGMKRLSSQGAFSKSKVMNNFMSTYKESTNHVETFLEEEQYESVDEYSRTGTSSKNLFQDFRTWCLDRGLNPHSSPYLNSELDRLGYVEYKNSSKHYRIKKMKLKNETGFEPVSEKSKYCL